MFNLFSLAWTEPPYLFSVAPGVKNVFSPASEGHLHLFSTDQGENFSDADQTVALTV